MLSDLNKLKKFKSLKKINLTKMYCYEVKKMDNELKNIIENIKVKYNKNIDISEGITNKELLIIKLQGLYDDLVKELGINEEIINLQIYINELRHAENSYNKAEVISIDNGLNFVQ